MDPLSTSAVYLNGLENEGQDCARAACGEHYERLVQLKYKYDPVIFSNQPKHPAARKKRPHPVGDCSPADAERGCRK
jgi:hypothetical protein